jgi:hypothetical protein
MTFGSESFRLVPRSNLSPYRSGSAQLFGTALGLARANGGWNTTLPLSVGWQVSPNGDWSGDKDPRHAVPVTLKMNLWCTYTQVNQNAYR